ncbi:MAG TPA: zinc-ribbon domain-containing protein [Candidatus Bathyarchaeota archaeon]|nr:zinc-ribbon domain-containing protein [Candidatus Bathyarchaeota archaeon]
MIEKRVVFKIYCSKCGEKLPEDTKFCPKCGNPVRLEATADVTVVERFERDPHLQDHWIKRAIAYIIDSIIVGAATAILLIIAMFPFFIGNPSAFFNILSFPFAMGLLYILYFSIAETMYGATFGKRLMGLTVATKSGGRPTFGQAFIRNISKIHQVLLLLDLIGGLITSTDLHQKYSDRIASTTVN